MNNSRLASIRAQKWYHILPIKPGQMLELHEKVGEGNNERIWKFKWLVIKVQRPNHIDGTFTIRWKAAGHTIEKIYPLSFTKFEKVILLDAHKIRRAKLYYLRDTVGKDARLKSNSTAEERGSDLLAIAIAEAEALLAAVAPVVEEVKEEASESTEEVVDQAADENTDASEEVKEETPTEEVSEETAPEVEASDDAPATPAEESTQE